MTITPESSNDFDQKQKNPQIFLAKYQKNSQMILVFKKKNPPNLYTDIAEIATKKGNLKSEMRKTLHPSSYQRKYLIYKQL